MDDPFQRLLGLGQVFVLAGERGEPLLQLVQLVEGVEIDRADLVDLAAERFDLLLDRGPLLRPLRAMGSSRQLGQLDAVVLAQPVGQRPPLVADLLGGELELMLLVAELRARGGEARSARRQRVPARPAAASRRPTHSLHLRGRAIPARSVSSAIAAEAASIASSDASLPLLGLAKLLPDLVDRPLALAAGRPQTASAAAAGFPAAARSGPARPWRP